MIPLRRGPIRTVVTIHDIVAYQKPETVPLKYALYMKFLIKLVANRADRVITPSICTKNDLVERLNVPESKIDVIYEAVGPRFTPPDTGSALDEIKTRFGIRDRYMLFAGNLEPRKNLIRLMEAFDLAGKKLNGQYQLVISGKKGWLYKDILRTYERLNRNNDIILTNYVNDEDLIKLYQAAEMFVFPTLYEGFGLPPLEAMACGTPVITSKNSSLPEITGDAAVLVNPFDIEEISEAMVKVATSDSYRNELGSMGIKQAGRFSWTNTALKTLESYRSVL